MEKILLDSPKAGEPTIMIFAEGTILKPKSWHALYNHNAYIPIGDCSRKIKGWQEQGAKNIFLFISLKGLMDCRNALRN